MRWNCLSLRLKQCKIMLVIKSNNLGHVPCGWLLAHFNYLVLNNVVNDQSLLFNLICFLRSAETTKQSAQCLFKTLWLFIVLLLALIQTILLMLLLSLRTMISSENVS